jgi:hypothetical protein
MAIKTFLLGTNIDVLQANRDFHEDGRLGLNVGDNVAVIDGRYGIMCSTASSFYDDHLGYDRAYPFTSCLVAFFFQLSLRFP